MEYDPIKDSLGKFFNRGTTLRIIFYKILDTVLLRTWHIHREIKKWKKTAPANAHILDAGSGFGQYSYYISSLNKNWCILGIDVKRNYIADCNEFFRKIKREKVYFKADDLVTFRKENAFDLILSVDVMEHILEDVEVFKNFHVSLRENGTLIISTPSDQGGSDVINNNGESFIGEHVRDGYNAQEIKDKLKNVGFSKVNVRYSYGMPGKIAWRLAMKWPMKALNITKAFFILLPVYYLLTGIPIIILHYIDTHSIHRSGTGLIVRAIK